MLLVPARSWDSIYVTNTWRKEVEMAGLHTRAGPDR